MLYVGAEVFDQTLTTVKVPAGEVGGHHAPHGMSAHKDLILPYGRVGHQGLDYFEYVFGIEFQSEIRKKRQFLICEPASESLPV